MLEHPHVRLISYSKPAAEVKEGLKDCQDLIAFCARVSNPDNQMNTGSSKKLLDYLIKHSHWSPFEMASACLEVTTTRDIARQILRHRSFSFQEFSQRYADPTKDLEFVTREARLQDEKNRQNSLDMDDKEIKEQWEEKQKMIIEMSKTMGTRTQYCKGTSSRCSTGRQYNITLIHERNTTFLVALCRTENR